MFDKLIIINLVLLIILIILIIYNYKNSNGEFLIKNNSQSKEKEKDVIVNILNKYKDTPACGKVCNEIYENIFDTPDRRFDKNLKSNEYLSDENNLRMKCNKHQTPNYKKNGCRDLKITEYKLFDNLVLKCSEGEVRHPNGRKCIKVGDLSNYNYKYAHNLYIDNNKELKQCPPNKKPSNKKDRCIDLANNEYKDENYNVKICENGYIANSDYSGCVPLTIGNNSIILPNGSEYICPVGTKPNEDLNRCVSI